MATKKLMQHIADADDLSMLKDFVIDKRMAKRSSAKRNRRNRHYENQYVRNILSNGHVSFSDNAT